MRVRVGRRDHGAVTTPLATAPRLYRRPDHGWLGGVAAGIAEHVGVSRRTVRVVFVVLALGGGLGVALYGAYLIVVPAAPDAGVGRFPRWLEYTITAICAASREMAAFCAAAMAPGVITGRADRPPASAPMPLPAARCATGRGTVMSKLRAWLAPPALAFDT